MIDAAATARWNSDQARCLTAYLANFGPCRTCADPLALSPTAHAGATPSFGCTTHSNLRPLRHAQPSTPPRR